MWCHDCLFWDSVFGSKACRDISLSQVWRRLRATSGLPLPLWPTLLPVRPPFPLLIPGIVSNIYQSEGLNIASLCFFTGPNLKMENIVHLTSLHSPFSSSGRLAHRCPGPDLSPESVCSSPSLSRLTYISVNDRTALPSPERPKVQLDWDFYTETLGSFLQFFYLFIFFRCTVRKLLSKFYFCRAANAFKM